MDWERFEELGHKTVALVVMYACGFVTCMLTVCGSCKF